MARITVRNQASSQASAIRLSYTSARPGPLARLPASLYPAHQLATPWMGQLVAPGAFKHHLMAAWKRVREVALFADFSPICATDYSMEFEILVYFSFFSRLSESSCRSNFSHALF